MSSKARQEYTKAVLEKLEKLSQSANQEIEKAAHLIFQSLEKGGIWHLFATGHSTMAVQEAFHRAGGLVPVNPWLEEYLMPQAGPLRTGPMERLSGVAEMIFNFYQPRPGEVLTIISNSGINPTTVEMAELARSKKIVVVGILNLEHSKKTPSRHPKKLKLYEVCDVVIDTGGVKGDAVVHLPNLDVPVGPLSTLLNAFIINGIAVSVCEHFSHVGKQAPVYLSANVEGGLEHNSKLEAQYRHRIRLL